MNHFSKINDIYASHMGENKPARSTIEAARLPRDVLVEVGYVAYPILTVTTYLEDSY